MARTCALFIVPLVALAAAANVGPSAGLAQQWTTGSLRGASTPPVIDAAGRTVVANGTFIAAFNGTTGSSLWSTAATLTANSSLLLVAASGVVIGSGQASLTAWNVTSGAQVWRTSLGCTATSPLLAGSACVFACTNGTIYAASTSTGQLLWRDRTVGITEVLAVVPATGGTNVALAAAGPGAGTLRAVNLTAASAAAGAPNPAAVSTMWTRNQAASIVRAVGGTGASAGTTFIVTTGAQWNVTAVSLANGVPWWTVGFTTTAGLAAVPPTSVSAPAVSPDGSMVYVSSSASRGAAAGRLHALVAADGNQAWFADATTQPVRAADGNGSPPGFTATDQFLAASPVVDARDFVYVVSATALWTLVPPPESAAVTYTLAAYAGDTGSSQFRHAFTSYSTSNQALVLEPITAPAVSPLGTLVAGTAAGVVSFIDCPIGFTFNATLGLRVPCSAGTYRNASDLVCTPDACIPGRYCPGNGSMIECPIGTKGPVAGLSSLSQCMPCEAGGYCDVPGQWAVTPCPANTYQPLNGQSNATACLLCAAGTFGVTVGQSSCQACPIGTSQPSTGIAAPPYPCKSCPPGTYAMVSGRKSCAPCPVGSWAASYGSSTCDDLCPPGSAGVRTGATSQAEACFSCRPGFYSEQYGSGSCTACPAGTNFSLPQASNSSQCEPCPLGYYSGAGSAECTLCPAGTFCDVAGTSTPKLCARGTWSSAVGATSNATCVACADSSTTATNGATAAADCQEVKFTCPWGYEPLTSATVKSLADCTPLVCASPLQPSGTTLAQSSSCRGCAVGTAGSVADGTCTSCATGVCPGFLSAALMNATTLRAAATAALRLEIGPAKASAAMESSSTASKCAGPVIIPELDLSVSTATVVFVATFFALIAVVLYVVVAVEDRVEAIRRDAGKPTHTVAAPCCGCWCRSSRRLAPEGAPLSVGTPSPVATGTGDVSESPSPPAAARRASCCQRVAAHSKLALETVDRFSLEHLTANGAAVVKRHTSLGGLCTIFGGLTLFVMGSILAIRRAEDNVLEQSSLAVLDANVGAMSAWSSMPWASVPQVAPGNASSELSGVQIRAVVQGEGSACASVKSWSYSGLKGGAWQLYSTPSLTGATSLSQHLFACPGCLFTGASTLTFSLHWSCQTIALDATAASATGTLVSVEPDSEASYAGLSAGSNTQGLLATVSWEVAPLFAIQTDDIAGSTMRGYQLVSVSSASTYRGASMTQLTPQSMTVDVTVSMPLQPFYAATTLTEKSSLLQLFSSIIGLAGIMAFFAKAFQVSEASMKARTAVGHVVAQARRGSAVQPEEPTHTASLASPAKIVVASPMSPVDSSSASPSVQLPVESPPAADAQRSWNS